MAAALKRKERGFECGFVEEPPPKYIQLECPLCLQILREPYQAPCCGKSFCQVCIEKVKTDNKPCPTCNEESLVIFHNKGLQCSLYGFQVYCSHKQEGCEWKGELGQLDNHLNLSPQPDKQLEGCEYSEIECIYCSELIKRPNITVHQTEHCPKRPFSCEYCNECKSHYEDIVTNHWPVCGSHPLKCPNECGTSLKRKALDEHIAKDCPETVIDCDFHHVGCNVKLPRKDMPAHLNENLVTHMSLQARTLRSKVEDFQKEVEHLKKENKALKEQVNALHHQFGSHAGTAPCDLFMLNFEQYRSSSWKNSWHSPSFYTHDKGYKLCLSVDANCEDGHGRVGVFLHMMRGDYDDILRWPFRGTVTFHLVDQTTDMADYAKKLSIDNSSEQVTKRVMEEEEEESEGWGFPKFISYTQLRPKYLKNNSLRFRVTFCHSI